MTCMCMHVCALHSPPLRCMMAQASFDLGGVITVIMREMAPIREMAPGCGKRSKKEVFNCISAPPWERWHQGAETKSRNKFLIVFSHPHRRDSTGCDLNDVIPRVSATATGPRGDIRAPLLSRTFTTGTCVVSTLFTRGNESSCFHLIGVNIIRSQTKLTTHIRYMPPTAPQITEGAHMVLHGCRRGRTRTTVGS